MNGFGLTTQQARILLSQYGLNQLPDKQKNSFLTLFISQFKNMLSLLLFIATLLSFLVGDKIDGFLIAFILVLNGTLGFYQEYKASKELQALKKLEAQNSRVIRDSKQVEVPTSQLVPGDILVLEAGDKIGADAQVLQSIQLNVNEASLTGESAPVIKTTDPENNQVYFGTVVISGRGLARVVKTGVLTKFGKVAVTLTEIKEERTVFEISLDQLAKKLAAVALVVAAILFVINLNNGYLFKDNIFTSIALMVAAVPEGLPSIVVLVLALGVRRMYKQKALVRRLGSIQDLGAVTVICTDKTGTITKNEMRVSEVFDSINTQRLMEASVLCNSASLVVKEDSSYGILGDSTEGALLLWAKDHKLEAEDLRKEALLVDEVPFSLESRMMITVWKRAGKNYLYAKGAPEVMLPLCKLTNKEVEKLTKSFQKLAGKGLRVLAFGTKTLPPGKISAKSQASNMSFLGFVGIADQQRPEAQEAIEIANRAGIKTVMITGDNDLTAHAIAEKVGLLKDGDEIMAGSQLDNLTDEQLLPILDKIKVFARVTPEHKLRIVKLFQQNGEIVVVTGDGVNDALALKQGQVGAAMGKLGTDVAKEASDIIILDDNFATIVSAIQQGRLVHLNIKKILKFLLAGNLAESLVIVGGALMGLPIPLLAVQILWVNLVSDSLPALALAADSPSKNIMHSPPNKNYLQILDFDTLKFIAFSGIIMSVVVLSIFIAVLNIAGLQTARTFSFSSLVLVEMVFVFFIRRHHSIWSNKFLLLSVAFITTLQILIVTVPLLRAIFKI